MPKGRYGGLKAAIAKLLRYGIVSAISTTVSLTTLTMLLMVNAVTPGWANVIATAVGTGPSFELNRRWVWRKTDRRSFSSEVVPFCALSFLGLALSTVAVSAAARWASAAGLTGMTHTMVVLSANAAVYGALWLVQFALLDRILFRQPAPRLSITATGEETATDLAA